MNPDATPTPTPTQETLSHTSLPPETSNVRLFVGVGIALLALLIGYVMLFTDVKLASYIPFLKDTVATVNGAPITRLEFENSVKNVTDTYQLQGINVGDEATQKIINDEAMKRLINTQLLLQEASAAGYSASEEAIDQQLAVVTEQFGGEAALETRLKELNITNVMLREDLGEQVVVSQYLENETAIGSITVSDEEVATFYENLKTQYGDQLPPLENIRPQIETDILAQKQQSLLSEILAGLRAQAEVKIKL